MPSCAAPLPLRAQIRIRKAAEWRVGLLLLPGACRGSFSFVSVSMIALPRLTALALSAVLLTACHNKPAGDASTATDAPAAELDAKTQATLRQTLAERVPQLPRIDEIRSTPMPGLYELRVGDADIFYTDAKGDYLIRGSLLDTRARKDLTQARVDALTAVDFKSLPLTDAIVTKRGTGARQLAVFEDPNCPYCHRFEAELAKVNNVTVYTFLMPILGPDSATKSQNIWCARDRNRAWDDWMLRRVAPAQATCDTGALSRNVAFGQKHHITGTPGLVFPNGKRVPGAVPAAELEKLLDESK